MMHKIIDKVNRDIVITFLKSIPLLNPSLFEPLVFLNTSSFLVLSPLLGLVLQQHKPIFTFNSKFKRIFKCLTKITNHRFHYLHKIMNTHLLSTT